MLKLLTEYLKGYGLFFFKYKLDVTKTTDNKSTFLHVLADAVNNRFPDVLLVMEDLPTVGEASKGMLSSYIHSLLPWWSYLPCHYGGVIGCYLPCFSGSVVGRSPDS